MEVKTASPAATRIAGNTGFHRMGFSLKVVTTFARERLAEHGDWRHPARWSLPHLRIERFRFHPKLRGFGGGKEIVDWRVAPTRKRN